MTMLARARMLGVMMVAMSLGMMVVAHAHSPHKSATDLGAQRWPQPYPPGLYRYYQDALAAQTQWAHDDAMARRFRRLGLYRYYQEALAAQARRAHDDAVARFHRRERAATEQATTGNSIRRWLPGTAPQPLGGHRRRWLPGCLLQPGVGSPAGAFPPWVGSSRPSPSRALTVVTVNRARARVRPRHPETIPE
jgi:hypothetical protein